MIKISEWTWQRKLTVIFTAFAITYAITVAMVPVTQAAMFDPSWGSCANFTVDSSYVDEDLTYRPMTLVINDSTINYEDTLPGGADFRAVDAPCNQGGSVMAYEIDTWNNATNHSVIHFMNKTLSSGSDSVFSYYWNNSGASDAQNASGVWIIYSAVYNSHNLNATAIFDSSSNAWDGEKKGSGEPFEIPGALGRAQYFDGSDDYINIGTMNGFWLNAADNITISWWMKHNGSDAARGMFFGDYNTGSNTMNYFRTDSDAAGAADPGKMQIAIRDEDDTEYKFGSTNDITDFNSNTWKHYSVVIDPDDNDAILYVDGVDTAVTDGVSEGPDNFADMDYGYMLGARNTDGGPSIFANVALDNVRFIGDDVSKAWLKVEYYSQTDKMIDYGSIYSPAGVDNDPVVSLLSPGANSIHTNTTITFNCSATDDIGLSSIALYHNATGTWHENATYSASGTSDYHEWTVTLPGPDTNKSVVWNCLATDSGANTDWGDLNRSLSLYAYDTSFSYDTLAYETDTKTMTFNVTSYSSIIDSITASLFYNGANESYDSVSNSGQNYSFIAYVVPDLATLNASNYPFNWVYTMHYTNGSTQDFNTTVTNQTIMYAYYPGTATKNSANFIETQDLNVTNTITDLMGQATLSMSLWYNDTAYTMSNVSSTYSYLLNTSMVPNDVHNYSVNFNTSLNVTYNGITRLRNTSTDTITVYKIILTNCTAPSTTSALGFFLKNEDTDAAITGDLDITFDVWKTGEILRNYSWEFTGQNNYSVCIYPAWASYTVDSMMSYEATGYSPRTYYLNDAGISNSSTTINLYLKDNTTTDLIEMRVLNAIGTPEEDVTINIARYNIGAGTYTTVAIVETNFDGYAYSYLTKDTVWYRFTLYDSDGEILSQYDPFIIVDDSLTFQLSDQVFGEWIDYNGQITGSCTFPSNTTTCTLVDTSGLMQSATLIVKKWTSLGYTDICEETGTSSSLTLVCDLGATTGYIFWYEFTAEFDNTHTIIESGYLDNRTPGEYDDLGLVATIMMILVLAMFGAWRWEIGVAGAGVAMGLSYVAGLIVMTWGSVVVIMVIIAIVIYQARSV